MVSLSGHPLALLPTQGGGMDASVMLADILLTDVRQVAKNNAYRWVQLGFGDWSPSVGSCFVSFIP